METKKWIINWFAQEKSIPENDLMNNFEQNYFDLGYISSLSFVALLVDIETAFNVEFNNDDFVDGSFFTIKGIIDALDEKIQKMEV